MLYFLPFLAVTASAASIPRQAATCSFVLTAVGESNGNIVEDTIGENRIGGTYAQGAYHITNNHLYDSRNHYCGISPTSHQFQCKTGSFGSTNFTLADDGKLLHDGSEKWVACPASGPHNESSYNIFSHAKSLDTGCEAITMSADGSCSEQATAATPSRPPYSIAHSACTNTTNSTGNATAACPTNLNNTPFQSPHLVVPTSPNATTHAFGPSTKAYISPINTTLFNFDIPSAAPYQSSTCSLLFLFPYGSDLDPNAGRFYFSGIEQEEGQHGGLDFALLSGVANNGTTFATTPSVATDFGKTQIIPGTNYTIGTFPCPAGKTVTIKGSSVNGVELDYFQDARPQPIGLYIVPCA